MRANEIYSGAKRQFSVRNRDVLMNAQFHPKWWSIHKSAVFSFSSPLPPIVVGVLDWCESSLVRLFCF